MSKIAYLSRKSEPKARFFKSFVWALNTLYFRWLFDLLLIFLGLNMRINFLYFMLLFSLFCPAMDKPLVPKEVVLKDKEDKGYPVSHKFNPQGTKLLVHRKEAKFDTLCVYDTSKGEFLGEIDTDGMTGYKWSPSGSFIVVKREDNTKLYPEDGKNVVHLDMLSWFGLKFSKDEHHVYAADKHEFSTLTVFNPKNGQKLAELPEGKLYAIDPLNKLIASSHQKTSFFSTETLEKIGEIDDSIRCYSQDGSLMGAWHWIGGDQGGHHSLYNRKFECVRTFEPKKGLGCFATIHPEENNFIAFNTDAETSFDMETGKQKTDLSHCDIDRSQDFFSWNGTMQIRLRHAKQPIALEDLKKVVDCPSKLREFFSQFDTSTHVSVADLKDNKQPITQHIVLSEDIKRIFYTSNPNVILVGIKHIVNLKTGQVITTQYGTQKQMEPNKRKIKHLISTLGAYVDVMTKEGEESVVIRQLDWNDAP